MSTDAESTETSAAGPRLDGDELRGGMFVALGVGLVALAATGVGIALEPGPALRGYLVGYFFVLGLPIGALGLELLHHLVGGDWGEIVRGPLKAAVLTLPVLALAFLPIAVGVGSIYPWAQGEQAAMTAYLTIPWFEIRSFVYFAFWLGLALWLYWDSPGYHAGQMDAHARRVRKLSAGGFVVYFMTTSFAYIDWAMSLDPDWISTIWGVMILVGHVLLALSALLVVVGLLARRADRLAEGLTPGRLKDLGNVLLVFVALWAYTSFAQYLIIWSGDKLHEIPWYLARAGGGWSTIPPLLIFFQFLVPLVALLFRPFKRSIVALGWLAAGIVVLRFVDTVWLLAPSFAEIPGGLAWSAYTTAIGLGGVVVAAWLWLIGRRPLYQADHLGHSTPMETEEIAHVPD